MTPHEREVMRMALAALEIYGAQAPDVGATISALRACLAQPEPEPGEQYSDIVSDGGLDPRNKLQREWVGLTDEEVELLDCVYLNDLGYGECEIDQRSVTMFSRAIEAKLKEKNI